MRNMGDELWFIPEGQHINVHLLCEDNLYVSVDEQWRTDLEDDFLLLPRHSLNFGLKWRHVVLEHLELKVDLMVPKPHMWRRLEDDLCEEEFDWRVLQALRQAKYCEVVHVSPLRRNSDPLTVRGPLAAVVF